MTELIDILDEKGIKYRRTNNPNELLIQCTNPDHDDHNPSLGYDLEKDIFKCWSCGYSGAKKKFLTSIGIYTNIYFESKQTYKISKLRKKLNSIMYANTFTLPKETTPVNGSFKNISKKVLTDFNTFFTLEQGLDDYLCIPVYQFGKLKFIEGRCRWKNDKKPRYLRRPANITISDVLFPIDKIDQTKHIILVEGIFDMLNLWENGFHNVLCIFGSQNFGKRKIDLLNKLNTLSVTLMMDGDEAGRRAASQIKSLLDKDNIQTFIVKLPEGVDPGDLSKDSIEFYMRNALPQ